MILIDNLQHTDASLNLALEEYCLRNLDTTEQDYLLFYINAPSIIIGKNQNTLEEINFQYVQENNIQVVRRISGGGAVYHDFGNLNFSFITKFDRSSVLNFKKFAGPVADALQTLGVDATLNGRNDIVVGERKISGNAQHSSKKNMFSHGTLLFDSDLSQVVEALNVKMEKIESKGLKSVRSRVANISEFLTSPIHISDFKDLLIAQLFKNETPEILQLTEEQWIEVYALANEKYRSWEWNFGKSPDFNLQQSSRIEGVGQIDFRVNVAQGHIINLKIYGDFLGHGDISELEKAAEGLKFEPTSLQTFFENQELHHYFGAVSAQQLTEILFYEPK